MTEGDSSPQATSEQEQLLTNANGDRDGEVILGVVDDPFTTEERYARVPYDRLRRGMLVAGDCGQGKSGLLTNLLVQLATDGHGFCFVDTNWNAVELLQRLPDHRLDDVVLIGDISGVRETNIHPFHLLEIPPSKEDVSKDVVANTLKSGSDYWSVEMDENARIAATVAAMNGNSLLELPDVADMESVDLPPDEPVAEELVESPLDNSQSLPLLKRIHDLRERQQCRELFDPNGVSIHEAVSDGKIIIGAFAGFDPTPMTVAATGLITKFTDVVFNPQQPVIPDEVYPLVVDQLDTANLPDGIISNIISGQGSSHNTPLICSLQYVEQLNERLQRDLQNNMANLLSFRMSNEQAANLLVQPLRFDERKELLHLDMYSALSNIQGVDGRYVGEIETIPMIAPRRSKDEVLARFNG